MHSPGRYADAVSNRQPHPGCGRELKSTYTPLCLPALCSSMMLSQLKRVRVRVISQSNKSAGYESEVYTLLFSRASHSFPCALPCFLALPNTQESRHPGTCAKAVGTSTPFHLSKRRRKCSTKDGLSSSFPDVYDADLLFFNLTEKNTPD